MLFEQIRVCSQQIEKVRIQRWYLPSAAESEELWQLFPHCLCSGTDIDKNLCLNVFCHPLHVKEASAQSDVQECFPWLTFWLKCLDSFFWSKITLLFLQTPLGLDYKDCLINKNEHYSLFGVQKSFSSLRELTSHYQHNKLLLAEVPVKLTCCCPPRPKGMFPQATDDIICLDRQKYKGKHTERCDPDTSFWPSTSWNSAPWLDKRLN